jgi:hypothetical protein
MPRVFKKIRRDGYEYVYLSHCCGFTRKQISERYDVPIKNITKLDSYLATFWRKI